MPHTSDTLLRKQIAAMLDGGHAHAKFDDAVNGIPANLRGVKPPGLPHSPWMLLEHLRIAQWDILDFSVNPAYKEITWPDEYWPKTDAPPDDTAWDASVAAVHRDVKAMQELVMNPATDLYAKIPWGSGQTVLREALLIVDHNAYHIGQLILVRRLLGAWTKS